MSGRLTDTIDPLALVSRERQIDGVLALSRMPRLQPLIRNSSDEARFRLRFQMEEGVIPTVKGVIESRFVLECQRCMGEMELPVTVKVHLGIVQTREQAERLPARMEPLLVSGGSEISIATIIEDELILALPTVAMHKIEDCPQGQKFLGAKQGSGEEPQASDRKNPFAALAQLKETLSADESNTDEE